MLGCKTFNYGKNIYPSWISRYRTLVKLLIIHPGIFKIPTLDFYKVENTKTSLVFPIFHVSLSLSGHIFPQLEK